jgi:hypothetical protein
MKLGNLEIAEKAACPAPVKSPKEKPLILLPSLSRTLEQDLRVEENPLSVAESIAFTEKLSAIFFHSLFQ